MSQHTDDHGNPIHPRPTASGDPNVPPPSGFCRLCGESLRMHVYGSASECQWLPAIDDDRDPLNQQHWLTFAPVTKDVVGCHCGFRSDLYQQSGYGDDVVDHLLKVGRAAQQGSLDRSTLMLTAAAEIFDFYPASDHQTLVNASGAVVGALFPAAFDEQIKPPASPNHPFRGGYGEHCTEPSTVTEDAVCGMPRAVHRETEEPLPADLQDIADLLWEAAHGAPPIEQDPIARHFRDHDEPVATCRLCNVTDQGDPS